MTNNRINPSTDDGLRAYALCTRDAHNDLATKVEGLKVWQDNVNAELREGNRQIAEVIQELHRINSEASDDDRKLIERMITVVSTLKAIFDAASSQE